MPLNASTLRLILVLTVAAQAGASCARSPAAPPPPITPAVRPAKPQPERMRAGTPLALAFDALDGRRAAIAPGRVTLVYFWASWCAPCKAELPHLRALYEALHREGFDILGISLDSRRADLAYFVEKEQIPWPQHFDGQGLESPLATRFGIEEIPTLWLVDRKGIVRDVEADVELEAKVRRLLAE